MRLQSGLAVADGFGRVNSCSAIARAFAALSASAPFSAARHHAPMQLRRRRASSRIALVVIELLLQVRDGDAVGREARIDQHGERLRRRPSPAFSRAW